MARALLGGMSNAARAKTRRKPTKAAPVNKLKRTARTRLTYATAALTPIMGATFAHYAAELGVQANPLGIVPAVIALAVLGVSLPHVASGLREVTGQSRVNCFLLAVGIDAGLIACKAGLTLGTLSAQWLLWGMVVILLTMSGAMNLVAYTLRHED